jgi:hypothetical protein
MPFQRFKLLIKFGKLCMHTAVFQFETVNFRLLLFNDCLLLFRTLNQHSRELIVGKGLVAVRIGVHDFRNDFLYLLSNEADLRAFGASFISNGLMKAKFSLTLGGEHVVAEQSKIAKSRKGAIELLALLA